MSASEPNLCEQEGRSPCQELCGLRERVERQDVRITAAIEGNNEYSQILAEISRRVGVMRPDGTATPHSITWAMQQLGEQMLALKRSIDDRLSSEPPPRLLDALGDLSESSRLDIQRPDLAILRRRKAIRQRNWAALGAGVAAFALGVIECLRLFGVLKGH